MGSAIRVKKQIAQAVLNANLITMNTTPTRMVLGYAFSVSQPKINSFAVYALGTALLIVLAKIAHY